MGTRSLTEVRSRWEDNDYETNAVIYRHWDGYPEVQGQLLYEFLDGMKLVNGIGSDMPEKYANGPGRLAAQLAAHMQADGAEPDLRPGVQDMGQEYHYQVSCDFGFDGGDITVTVFDGPMTAFGMGGEECDNEVFSGDVEAFGEFIKTYGDED